MIQSAPLKIKSSPPPSSSGLGRGPFKATTGVRIPVGAPLYTHSISFEFAINSIGRVIKIPLLVLSMMSPKVLEADNLIFWFHSYDALHENRASVHVGKGSQDDYNDAKIWLEPKVEVMRAGKTLRTHELNKALKAIEQDLEYLLEEWHGYKRKANG